MTLQGRSRAVWIAMIFAVTAAVLGLVTLYRENPDAGPLDLTFWLLQMFTADSLPVREPDNLAFDVARVLAPLATFTAVIGLGLELMSERYTRWRIRRRRNHTVICGFRDGGRELAVRERSSGRRVVVIEAASAPADEALCSTHGIGLLHADPRRPEVLEAAAVTRAARLVIVTGTDKANLDVAAAAGRLLAAARRRKAPLAVFASINDSRLWDELSRSDAIRRTSGNCRFRAFNPRDLVARRFFQDEPICRIAEIRAQAGVHAVFLGCGPYGQALIVHLLRASVYRNFPKPAITVLCADAPEEMRRLRLHCPQIEELADIAFENHDPGADALDEMRMAEVETNAPVTAVFVCMEGDDAALRTAVYLRDSMHRHDRWRAPVYVRMSRYERVDNLLDTAGESKRFEDRLQFFGSDAEHCDLDMIDGELEELARRIHETYRASRTLRAAQDFGDSREEPLAPWDELRETYREANRRAAGHVKAKLASAGCVVPRGTRFVAPAEFRLAASPVLREALAGLEHRSWCLGRRLDGWRSATRRDNRRRLHDKLVPYQALPEAMKEYDRDQIDFIDERLIERREPLAPGEPAVRREHRIGLIGRNRISVEEARWARGALADQVLPGLLAEHADRYLTLMTPLAPGLDLILTQAALSHLAELPHPHELIVAEGVPESAMVDDYRESFEAGSAWNGAARDPDEAWDGPDDGGRARILAERQAIIRDAACSWLVDLSSPAADYSQQSLRQKGYRAAGDYVAGRADTLIVATHGNAPSRPGGIAETLERRGSALAARLADWPSVERCATIILELDTRRISVHRDDDCTTGTSRPRSGAVDRKDETHVPG